MRKMTFFSYTILFFLTGMTLFTYGQTTVTLRSDLSGPYNLALDASGNYYVADLSGNAIRKIDPTGSTMVTLGSGFNGPSGVAVDASGNIYVADGSNNAIKKMDANGGNITTLVGSGLSWPSAIAIDNTNGMVYFCDSYNGAVKKMTLTGANLTTVATGLGQPTGIALDSSGNMYVGGGTSNNVYKIAPDGTKTTLGSFSLPRGIALDSSGNIYIAESGSSLVKKMDSNGANVTTLTTSATGSVFGVAINASNELLWVSLSAKKLYKLSSNLGTNNVRTSNINLTPNPAKDFVTISNLTKGAVVSLFDMSGKLLYAIKTTGTTITINTSSYKNGIYLVKVDENTSKLIISK